MYDGKVEGGILIVGRTGCGKTTFVQNLGKNKLFGDVRKYIVYLKLNYPKIEKTISETVLLIRL